MKIVYENDNFIEIIEFYLKENCSCSDIGCYHDESCIVYIWDDEVLL